MIVVEKVVLNKTSPERSCALHRSSNHSNVVVMVVG